MDFFVYILYSASVDQFYKGQTKDLNQRLKRHNDGLEDSTKKGAPWKLVWHTKKTNRSEAIRLEAKLKNLSKVRLIKFMLEYNDGIASHDEFLFLQKLS